MKIRHYFAGHMTKTVFAKTTGLADRTAKFQNCLANLSDSMSDKKLIQKNVQTVFLGYLIRLMKIAHISCIFSTKYAVFTKWKDQYSN